MEKIKKDKWYIAARILLGIILLPNAVAPFFVEPETLGMPAKALETFKFFWNTGYLMYLVKFIELITGLSMVTNRYIKFTTLLFTPIAINIVLFHLFLAPAGLVLGLITLILTIFVAIKNMQVYKELLNYK
jgi:putative oxidoreductase